MLNEARPITGVNTPPPEPEESLKDSSVTGDPDNPGDWHKSQMKGIELNGRDCGSEFYDPEDAQREHPDITTPL